MMYSKNITNKTNWRMYRNGNYDVWINLEDGTKIRENDLDNLTPEFPESIDLNITNKCNIGCPYCYQNCTADGKHAELKKYTEFINSIRPYTEVAINGNDLDHPQLIDLLKIFRERNVIANITVHKDVLMKKRDALRRMCDDKLIHGLGISFRSKYDPIFNRVIKSVFPNTVIHVVAGLFDRADYDYLKDTNAKLLILGYKHVGRGIEYLDFHIDDIAKNWEWLEEKLPFAKNDFSAIGFDTLALEQLHINIDDNNEKYFMGDDGDYTLFVDLVSGEYAKNSTTDRRKTIKEGMTVDDMFKNLDGEDDV